MDAASKVYSAAQALRTGGAREVRAALLAARARTLKLIDAYVAALGSSSLRVPYRATLNPPLWEWGHVAWFQEWWVGRNRERSRGIACDPAHVRGPSVMAGADATYDSSRIAHRDRWDAQLAPLDATRRWLETTLNSTLDALSGASTHNELYFFRLTAMHEEMHAEAGVYMAEALGIQVPHEVLRGGPALKSEGAVLRFGGGEVTAGGPQPGFAFDNELPPVRVRIDPFEIDAEPVGWRAFLEFARSGGYEQRRWWDDAGWTWLQAHGVPDHERHAAGQQAATHISAHEAQAWCRWAGRRLPTEFEWEFAATSSDAFSWGQAWEWTSSVFAPYPGFEPHPYRDYSAPWFGTRQVLRGACPATAATLAHPKYRNFFEPGRSDIFAGFRSCK